MGLMLAGLVAPTAEATDPNLSKPVPTQANFSYVGSFALPGSYSTGSSGPCNTLSDGCSTAFSYGALAYRYVNNQLQFFTSGHVYNGGRVYELTSPVLPTILMPPALSGCRWPRFCAIGAIFMAARMFSRQYDSQ